MRKRNYNIPRKSSETVMARTLAKLLKVAPSDTVVEVCQTFHDAHLFSGPLVAVLNTVQGAYPINIDVANVVMGNDVGEVLLDLVIQPDVGMIVKDTARSSQDGLWYIVADPSESTMDTINKLPCQMLVRQFNQKEDLIRIVAIKLLSCPTR